MSRTIDLNTSLAGMAEARNARYLLVNVIMKRARELYTGHKPMVKAPEGADAGTVANIELMNDRLKVQPRKGGGRLVDIAGGD